MGVVQAVTSHVNGHTATTFGKAYPGGATPAQLGAATGYSGKAASALRAAVARQHAQGTKQQGITRYPPLTYAQWCNLLGVAAKAGDPKAQAQAAKVWAAARKGTKQAKQQAKRTAQAKQAS